MVEREGMLLAKLNTVRIFLYANPEMLILTPIDRPFILR